MDKLDAMRLFVRVTEAGSFAAVAEQRGVARSVVTRAINALEAGLGVKLLARSTRRLALTSAGADYLEKCRQILDLVESAESDLAHERARPRGRIRVSLPLSFGLKRLAPLLLDFSARHPEVQLETEYSDARSNLIEEGFDLSIRVTDRLGPGDVTRRLSASRMLTLASPAYLARRGTPSHPADLRAHDCLGYLVNGQKVPWQFQVDGRTESMAVPSRLFANNGEVLAQAAARGMGITVQPDFIAEDFITRGELVPLLADYAPRDVGIYAILPGHRFIPHRVRVLIDALAQELGDPQPARAPMR